MSLPLVHQHNRFQSLPYNRHHIHHESDVKDFLLRSAKAIGFAYMEQQKGWPFQQQYHAQVGMDTDEDGAYPLQQGSFQVQPQPPAAHYPQTGHAMMAGQYAPSPQEQMVYQQQQQQPPPPSTWNQEVYPAQQFPAGCPMPESIGYPMHQTPYDQHSYHPHQPPHHQPHHQPPQQHSPQQHQQWYAPQQQQPPEPELHLWHNPSTSSSSSVSTSTSTPPPPRVQITPVEEEQKPIIVMSPELRPSSVSPAPGSLRGYLGVPPNQAPGMHLQHLQQQQHLHLQHQQHQSQQRFASGSGSRSRKRRWTIDEHDEHEQGVHSGRSVLRRTSLDTLRSGSGSATRGSRRRADRAGRTSFLENQRSSSSGSGGGTFTVFAVTGASTSVDEPIGSAILGTIDLSTSNDNVSEVPGVEHGPTNLPPVPYPGGREAVSPWKPRRDFGTIPGSAMDYLPILERRMERLEDAISAYVEYRGQKALRNSILVEPAVQRDQEEQSGRRGAS